MQKNCTSWADEALKAGLNTIIWTDTKYLKVPQIQELQSKGVLVKDYRECSNSRLFKYTEYFLQYALQNDDKTSFALASDVLRMAILDLHPEDETFIYVDGNDVQLTDLKTNLITLDDALSMNDFGLSFYAKILADNTAHLRNDVLIAKKAQNPAFFVDCFVAYADILENNYTKI